MALRLRGLGTNANQNVSDFLRRLGECVGLEVFLDENGNVRRAAGPLTPANGQGGNANSLRGNRAQTRGRIRYSNGTTTTLDLQDGNITGVR